jgi:hypothetical protein
VSESCGGFCWFQEARVGLNGGLTFTTQVAVAGGGISRFTKLGMTTLNDAGAAGVPAITFDPTNDTVRYGSATWNFIVAPAGGYISCQSPGFKMNVASAYVALLTGGNFGLRIAGTNGDATEDGWLLAKGVCGDDHSHFINTDWSVVEAAGSKWRIQTVTAPIRVAGIGGIWRFATANVTPCVLDGWSNSYNATSGWRMWARFAIQSVADDAFLVGVSDAPAAVAPNSMPYVNDGAFIVHISGLGANFFHRTIVAAGAVSVDTGIPAVVGEYVRVDQIARADRTIQLYINGTLVTTSVAAQSPLAATLLRKAMSANNSGAAVSAQLDIDVYDIVESANVAVTP